VPPPGEREPGVVTTLMNDAELVIRISGEVDLCLRPQLRALARRLARYHGQAVIDLTDVTFCDGTLAGFLAENLGQGPAIVKAPTRISREFLVLYGLDRGVRVVG
jgi:anti-anti-sigma regulatory factor